MLSRRKALGVLSAASVTPLFPTPMLARTVDVEFKLVLFLDQSSSEYDKASKVAGIEGRVPHWIIQRDAHIEALNTPAIMTDLINHQVYVELVRWSDTQVVDFAGSMLDNVAIKELTGVISTFPDQKLGDGGTQHKLCQEYMLQNVHVGRFRQVADVSTDDGLLSGQKSTVRKLQQQLAQKSIVELNVISLNHENLTRDLRALLQSPGGFTIGIDNYGRSSNNDIAISYDEYRDALRRKFVAEISWLVGKTKQMRI